MEKKEWEKGIPLYHESDLMTELELLHFAMKIVMDFEIKPNSYEIISTNNKIGTYPNFVLKKDNLLYFIVVGVAIAPKMPILDKVIRSNLLKHAKSFNAISYYAPVSFGSSDAERFEASLALRGDGFYANYKGLELLNS
jgi:hypothetical protein